MQFTVGPTGLTSLAFKEQSFYMDGGAVVQSALFQAPDGTTSQASLGKPASAAQPDSPTSFQQVYNAGGAHQFTVKVVFTTPDARTLQAAASVTNNDAVNTLAQISLHLISLTLPGAGNPGVAVGQPLQVNQYSGNLVTLFHGSWGSVASWISGYPTPASLFTFYNSASQTAFANTLRNYSASGPNTYSLTIAPGQTQVFTQSIRFGRPEDTAAGLAPEAYAEFRAAYPYLLNWPDRRPIGIWLIADATNGRSANNPRGYLWDKSLNAGNPQTFQSRVLAQADATIANMNRVYPKPQGIIIWDLEGQEFIQPFTYVGHPDFLPQLAPEMDSVADQLFAKFSAAGYKIGVTIRPQTFLIGTNLPSSCYSTTQYDAVTNYSFAEKFIKLDAVYPYRGYYCLNGAFTLSKSNQPSAQTDSTDYDKVLGLIRQKIAYARTRWGASIFYMDSDVWPGGAVLDPSIFRQLAIEFPDCLIIPEFASTPQFGATAPYEAGKVFNYYGTSAARRDVYPQAFGAVNMADADWQNHWTQLVQAVAAGDLLLFRAWFPAPEVPVVQQIYAAAGAAK